MSVTVDTKFSFLNSHCGPGGRRGHHVPVAMPLERSRSEPSVARFAPARGASLPGMGIPAGFSPVLGNKLGLAAYANLNGRYHAKMAVPPPCSAPCPKPAARMIKVQEEWVPPPRLRPETLPPAGGLKERIRGKRLIEDNTNTMSNVDTLIWGRDMDGSLGCRKMLHTQTYQGAAGSCAKTERLPAWGEVPPVCHRTFGEDALDDNWDQVHYERHDPRLDYLEP